MSLAFILMLQFSFARLEYSSDRAARPEYLQSKNWFTDFSDTADSMDRQLTELLKRTTRIDAQPFVQIKPSSPDIFKYPFLYAVEPEQITFTDLEALNMREYLQRGGFLMMDDFHGNFELTHVLRELRKLGIRSLQKLTPAHEVFHSLFDLDEIIQVPVVNSGVACFNEPETCRTWETQEEEPPVIWIAEIDGRVAVLLAQNEDLGDGLEFADDPQYPLKYSSFSYKFFTNVIVYVLSH